MTAFPKSQSYGEKILAEGKMSVKWDFLREGLSFSGKIRYTEKERRAAHEVF